MVLPTPIPPFPVTGRYEVSAGLRPLGERVHGRREAGHFEVDADLPRYLEARLQALRAHPEAVRCVDPRADTVPLLEALWAALGVLADEHPDRVRRESGGLVLTGPGVRLRRGGAAPEAVAEAAAFPEAEAEARDGPAGPGPVGDIRAHLLVRRDVELLTDALALSVAEDHAVVRAGPPPDGDAASLLHVAFPGHWDPREKVGRSFGEIHRPVAHNERLVRPRAALVRAMVEKGPFVRHVWGVTTSGRLALNPGLAGQRPPTLPDAVLRDPEETARRCVFRVERQTTRPLPHRQALFTIRVHVQPLMEAAATAERRRLLADALDSMDAAALAYKGLTRLRDPLVAWLRSP